MQDWIQIVVGIGAAILVMLLITVVILFIKLIRLRRSNEKKKRLQMQEELAMVPPWRNGSVLMLASTLQNGPSSDPLYQWNSDDQQGKGSMESLSSSTDIFYSGDERLPSHLSPEVNTQSRDDIREVPACDEDFNLQSSNQQLRIDFELLYKESTSTLHVRVTKVTNIPFRYRKTCSSFVKVSLLARRKSSVQTNVIRKTLNPEYKEWFEFPGYSITEINQYTIRFIVYVKLFGNLKNKFIGDLYYPISKKKLTPENLLTCTEFITSSRKKIRASNVTNGDLGQLFLLLQYQSSAERMKVLVRKAENLPKPKNRLFQPDYYVIINLVRGDEAVTFSETRSATGLNPIWNQPFLFDIPSNDIDKFRLQFVVMRGRIYSRDGIVGQVILGPETNPMGISHWHDATQPRGQEVAKWHQIQPL